MLKSNKRRLIMKRIYMAIGVIGSVIAGFFGGWTQACQTLVIFMGIDYISV